MRWAIAAGAVLALSLEVRTVKRAYVDLVDLVMRQGERLGRLEDSHPISRPHLT